MPRRNDLISSYATALRDKCGVAPDMGLLERIAIGCGPLIYHEDTALVSADSPVDHAQIKNNFLIRKLGMADTPLLDEAINAMFDICGGSETRKFRAVIYYLLVRHFGKEGHYR